MYLKKISTTGPPNRPYIIHYQSITINVGCFRFDILIKIMANNNDWMIESHAKACSRLGFAVNILLNDPSHSTMLHRPCMQHNGTSCSQRSEVSLAGPNMCMQVRERERCDIIDTGIKGGLSLGFWPSSWHLQLRSECADLLLAYVVPKGAPTIHASEPLSLQASKPSHGQTTSSPTCCKPSALRITR